MDIASWNNLGVWRDRLWARGLANELRPYLGEPQDRLHHNMSGSGSLTPLPVGVASGGFSATSPPGLGLGGWPLLD